jgi:hypothetical protein
VRLIWLWPNTMAEPLHEHVSPADIATLEPSELNLPADLIARLDEWQEMFMAQEPMWDWNDFAERQRFLVQGWRLAADLQEALGEEFEVHLVDRLQPRVSFFTNVAHDDR